MPRAGAIRLGEKIIARNGKQIPAARGSFRFTSADEHALAQLAAVYGGTVEPWSDQRIPERMWQLSTDATEIDVVLPPEPIDRSYELWTAAGCSRRCDGRAAVVFDEPGAPDGVARPCVCTAQDLTECTLTTRVELLIPQVRLAGVWTLRTGSIFAAVELPAMVELARRVAGPGMIGAKLRIAQRRTVTNGETKRFVVPTIALPGTLAELTAGSTRDALGPGATPDPSRAELAAPPPTLNRRRHLFAALAKAGVADHERHDWAAGHLRRTVESFGDLSDLEVVHLIALAETEASDDEHEDADDPRQASEPVRALSRDVPEPAVSQTPRATPESARSRECVFCAGSVADGRPVRRAPGGWSHVECAP